MNPPPTVRLMTNVRDIHALPRELQQAAVDAFVSYQLPLGHFISRADGCAIHGVMTCTGRALLFCTKCGGNTAVVDVDMDRMAMDHHAVKVMVDTHTMLRMTLLSFNVRHGDA
jgi:hypothetical protein